MKKKDQKATGGSQKAREVMHPKSIVMEEEIAYQSERTKKNNNYSIESSLPSVSSFLGKGNKVLIEADNIENKHYFISIIREGVKKHTLEHLMKATDINSQEMAAIMHTSERTLRRYNGDTKLNPEQSERVIELARLFTRGAEVFGSLNAFKEWMNNTIVALGNKKPKELLDTSLGIEILIEELGRIEHGIFA